MVDIHCHILHDIDDGAESFDTSFEMAMLAVEGGTTEIIATPHANILDGNNESTPVTISEKVKNINAALARENVPLKIYTGCEIFAAGEFIKLLKRGELLTLNNSNYVLVEFDFFEHYASVLAKLEELLSEGFIPVVAHPERYAFVEENGECINAIKNMGCLIQCNKGSVTGRFGRAAKFISHEMLVREQVDFIASDAHSLRMRTPILTDAYQIVCELYNKAYADLLFENNPRKILNHEKI
jgi:protein-tyrosine phosphatase